LDRQLYLPKEWLSPGYAQRRQKCRVPEDLSYESKTRIALKLVQRVHATGRFPVKWVGCDAYFGADSEFLEEIDALGLTYFADIRSNTQVWLEWPQVGIPPYKGRGPRPKKAKPLTPSRAVAAIAGDTQLHWQRVKLAEGAKGPVFADVARLRVVTSRDGMPNREQWLYLRRLENDKVKYALSNAADDVTLEEMNRAATMRWSIEQCFEECKQNLGMDHYEMRSWLGWHRHMLYVFLAHLFLLKVRLKFKKTPILTLAQAQRLVVAALAEPVLDIQRAVEIVNYHLKRNYIARVSHSKKRQTGG